MSDVIRDKYKLAQSPTKTIAEVAEEIRIDLNLTPCPNLHGGTIQGTVTDENEQLIQGAVIKIMDSDYNPIAHTITGSDGKYIFTPFPPGSDYHLYVSAVGYELETIDPFTLNEDQTLTKDIRIKKDITSKLSFIAGDVFADKNQPIMGAVVQLFSIVSDVETLVGLVFSNEYGQYVFRELPQGNYSIRISALGYISVKTDVSITAPSTISKIVTNMNVDPVVSKGTISGIITDENNNPIVDADVILYRVEKNKSLTPIALTKTIANGVYLFVNTAPGDYKVKSTKTASLE